MSSSKKRKQRIVESAERLFGDTVLDLEAPGGDGRSSYRLVFADRSVIATLRPNFRRTHVEAYTLRQIRRFSSDLPECLGVDDEILFQSDVGGKRLNIEIAKVSRSKRVSLAHDAIASIFRIQSAGRRAKLEEALPHLGQNKTWVESFVGSTSVLGSYSSGQSANMDVVDLCEKISYPGKQFVKWDCRSGNAAIGGDDKLRWFDCEYAGARHGAEDFAWLIGDEAWPLQPDVMEELVADCFDKETGHSLDAYLDYLALYTSFHCLQRFKLIVNEAKKRGWLSKTQVRKYDDVGVHPEFAAHLCRIGQYFADRNALTRPLARDFEEAEAVFVGILRNGLDELPQDHRRRPRMARAAGVQMAHTGPA